MRWCLHSRHELRATDLDPHNTARPLNGANALTALRALLVPVSAWAIANQLWTVAAGAFVIAVVSDLLDGPLARRSGTVSAFGGLFDHGTDAAFVVASTAAAVWLGLLPIGLPVLIALAFAQYVIDSGANRGRALRASWLGRCNGIAYFVLLGFIVLQPALGITLLSESILYWVGWGLLLSTAASMLDRLLAAPSHDVSQDD